MPENYKYNGITISQKALISFAILQSRKLIVLRVYVFAELNPPAQRE